MIDAVRVRSRAWVGAQLRRGRREVVQTRDTARVGNLLYFWLHADVESRRGRDLRVLLNDDAELWRPYWPEMLDRFATPTARRTDRLIEVDERHFQTYGHDFTKSDLREFIEQHVLTAEFVALMPPRDASMLVVNVRRGDYYSNPEYRERYTMDLQGYLREAVSLTTSNAAISRVAVVSDDPDWCARHLGWLGDVGEVHQVMGGAAHHLAYLSSAVNLILANSTFSYWGGYVAGAHRAGALVVAPRFHARHVNDGKAWQLDPQWSVVEP